MAIGKIYNRKEAVRLKERAKYIRDPLDAKVAEEVVNEFLGLPQTQSVGTGGELVPTGRAADDAPGFVDTVKNPDLMTQHASLQRLDLMEKAGVLDLASDMAETIQAQNSMEKSLAHQMSAAHKHCMDLFAEASRQRFPVEKARLSNAAARMMAVFQEGALTLQKLRSGGQQKMTVVHQYVQVEGGQVAVTGSMERKPS